MPIVGMGMAAVMVCAGISDVLTKSLGSANPYNMVWATVDGLRRLVTPEQVARERDLPVESIAFRPRQEVSRG